MLKKILKSIVQTVYRNSHYLNCKQTSNIDIHVRFQGYFPVSTALVYITTDECTPWRWPKNAETCKMFTSCLYVTVCNYSAVVMYTVTCLTVWNTDYFKTAWYNYIYIYTITLKVNKMVQSSDDKIVPYLEGTFSKMQYHFLAFCSILRQHKLLWNNYKLCGEYFQQDKNFK
jgi:hypothetical protein